MLGAGSASVRLAHGGRAGAGLAKGGGGAGPSAHGSGGAASGEGMGRAVMRPPVAAKVTSVGDSVESHVARRFGDASSKDTTAAGRLGLRGSVRVPRSWTSGPSSSELFPAAATGKGASGCLRQAYCEGGRGGRPSAARQAVAWPRCAARACGDRNSRLHARHTLELMVWVTSAGGRHAACVKGLGGGGGGTFESHAASFGASPVQTPHCQGPSTGAGKQATWARGPRHEAHVTMRPSLLAHKSHSDPGSTKASSCSALM